MKIPACAFAEYRYGFRYRITCQLGYIYQYRCRWQIGFLFIVGFTSPFKQGKQELIPVVFYFIRLGWLVELFVTSGLLVGIFAVKINNIRHPNACGYQKSEQNGSNSFHQIFGVAEYKYMNFLNQIRKIMHPFFLIRGPCAVSSRLFAGL